LNRIAGTSVREYGAVVPLGLDGSFMVYERLEPQDLRRRLAAEQQYPAGLHHTQGPQHGHSHHFSHPHQQQYGGAGQMGPLQRVMRAWAEEEQVGRSKCVG